jgi:hypothetical protein
MHLVGNATIHTEDGLLTPVTFTAPRFLNGSNPYLRGFLTTKREMLAVLGSIFSTRQTMCFEMGG